MTNVARAAAGRLVKGALRALGYTLAPLPTEADYRFAPRPEDRHRWLQALGIRTVLDVGAHRGESALQFRDLFPDAMVYSFEPLGECFQELEAKLAGRPRHQVFHMALGDSPGTATMHRSEYSPSSSLLEMSDLHKSAYPFSAADRAETVEVATLDALASRLDLQAEILLKIDTQGFEKKVLAGAEGTLPRIRAIIVETSFGELYRGQPRFGDIYAWLAERGYEYRGSWDQFLSPRDGMPLQQDGIFLRPGP